MSHMTSSKALTKRNSDNALMPPPPPPKRIKRPAITLDEDVYTGALSHIIARDFFPGLLETQAQQEYLDAVDSQDREWIVEAGRKLNQAMTPGAESRRLRGKGDSSATPVLARAEETPHGWTGTTPNVESAVEEDSHRTAVDLNMSLSTFTAKYTSEDNESFNALLDEQNVKRREKNAWLWNGNNIPSGRQLAHRERESRALVGSGPRDTSPSCQLVLHTSVADHRKAMPGVHRYTPKNTLMFTPDSIEDEITTVAQKAENDSNAAPKAVLHHNTRFPLQIAANNSVPPSPSVSAVDAAIAGVPRRTSTDIGYSGNDTPRVNGYTYVDELPEYQSEQELSLPDASTLLARLGNADETPNPFKIVQSSKREQLHHRLVEKTAMKKRKTERLGSFEDHASTPVSAQTSKFTSRANLTPAAQRLLERVGTPLRKGAFDDEHQKQSARTPLQTPVKIKRHK